MMVMTDPRGGSSLWAASREPLRWVQRQPSARYDSFTYKLGEITGADVLIISTRPRSFTGSRCFGQFSTSSHFAEGCVPRSLRLLLDMCGSAAASHVLWWMKTSRPSKDISPCNTSLTVNKDGWHTSFSLLSSQSGAKYLPDGVCG